MWLTRALKATNTRHDLYREPRELYTNTNEIFQVRDPKQFDMYDNFMSTISSTKNYNNATRHSNMLMWHANAIKLLMKLLNSY